MNNEEMFLTILNRLDNLEAGLNGRMDNLDGRIDKLESEMKSEFFAVRAEMDFVYKSSQEQFDVLNSKFDKFMYTKDVEGYDKIDVRLEVVERGYQELKEKIV